MAWGVFAAKVSLAGINNAAHNKYALQAFASSKNGAVQCDARESASGSWLTHN